MSAQEMTVKIFICSPILGLLLMLLKRIHVFQYILCRYHTIQLIVWKLLEFPAMVDELCSYFLSSAVFLQMSTKGFD